MEKCHLLTIKGGQDNRQYLLEQGGQTCACSPTIAERDLGVKIDSKLSFEQHISEKVAKANQVVGMIFRSFRYLDEDSFTLLFKSMVRPHLEYASPVWSPHLKRLVSRIERVQRRATRRLPQLREKPYSERLKNLGLPTLEYRRLRSDMV